MHSTDRHARKSLNLTPLVFGSLALAHTHTHTPLKAPVYCPWGYLEKEALRTLRVQSPNCNCNPPTNGMTHDTGEHCHRSLRCQGCWATKFTLVVTFSISFLLLQSSSRSDSESRGKKRSLTQETFAIPTTHFLFFFFLTCGLSKVLGSTRRNTFIIWNMCLPVPQWRPVAPSIFDGVGDCQWLPRVAA